MAKPEEDKKVADSEPEGSAKSKKGVTPKEIATGFAFVCLLLGFVYLVVNGILQDAAVAAAELGPVGHLIFIVLYIFVAMPFGWGYSVVIVAAAYSFGIEAIVTAEIGTLVGSFSAYLLCKNFLSGWVRAGITNMKPKTQRTLLAIELALRHGKGGLGMQMGLRVNPVLPYGWTNAVLGVWEVAPLNFLCSTMLGCQVDIILKTNVGLLLKTAGDLNKQTPETKKLVQTQLIIQCAVFVVVLGAGTFYSRWIMKNVMPQDGADAETTVITVKPNNHCIETEADDKKTGSLLGSLPAIPDEAKVGISKDGTVAAGDFDVKIDRASLSDATLGLSLDFSHGNHLLVESVNAGGLVEKFGISNPALQVSKQDRIVAVNGIRTSDQMVRELQKKTPQVTLKINRGKQ